MNQIFRFLAIDPGGTTGIYFRSESLNKALNEAGEEFFEIKQDWKTTYQTIQQLIQEKQPDFLLFEDTNYIGRRTKEGLNFFRLLGALECLPVQQIKKVNVLEVKKLTKQLFKGIQKIADLEYLPGRGKGWMFKGKRISIHCLEAYLVYYLFVKVKQAAVSDR